SGSRRSPSVVEPVRSQKSTVTRRRDSVARSSSGVPHARQKRACGGFSSAQRGHVRIRRVWQPGSQRGRVTRAVAGRVFLDASTFTPDLAGSSVFPWITGGGARRARPSSRTSRGRRRRAASPRNRVTGPEAATPAAAVAQRPPVRGGALAEAAHRGAGGGARPVGGGPGDRPGGGPVALVRAGAVAVPPGRALVPARKRRDRLSSEGITSASTTSAAGSTS